MTWFGIVLVCLFAFNVAHGLIRAGDGGYEADYSPRFLVFVSLANAAILLGLLFIGTGSV